MKKIRLDNTSIFPFSFPIFSSSFLCVSLLHIVHHDGFTDIKFLCSSGHPLYLFPLSPTFSVPPSVTPSLPPSISFTDFSPLKFSLFQPHIFPPTCLIFFCFTLIVLLFFNSLPLPTDISFFSTICIFLCVSLSFHHHSYSSLCLSLFSQSFVFFSLSFSHIPCTACIDLEPTIRPKQVIVDLIKLNTYLLLCI